MNKNKFIEKYVKLLIEYDLRNYSWSLVEQSESVTISPPCLNHLKWLHINITHNSWKTE